VSTQKSPRASRRRGLWLVMLGLALLLVAGLAWATMVSTGI
jgi:hypothetical protein